MPPNTEVTPEVAGSLVLTNTNSSAIQSSTGSPNTPAAPNTTVAPSSSVTSSTTGVAAINAPSPTPLSTEHEDYLAARGVPLAVAQAAGLRSVSGAEAAKLLGFSRPVPGDGLAIPYEGVTPPYVRVRNNDEKVAGARFFAPAGREVPVYRVPIAVNAAAAANRAVPSATGATPAWVPPPAAISKALVIVEGPIKALAVATAGIECVGLGGVSTTLTQKNGLHHLNSSWPSVAGREVIICFDAGVAWNASVARAQNRLAQALKDAGAASVRVSTLPKSALGGDQGPDDYLAQQGASALWRVLGQAVEGIPLERANAAVGAKSAAALNSLLDDLSFRLAVLDADIGAQRTIKDLLINAGLKPGDWASWFKKTKDLAKQAAKQAQRASALGGDTYEVRQERLCIVTSYADDLGNDDEKVTPLCNFVAEIQAETTFDDGVVESIKFTIAGKVAQGEQLRAVEIEPKEFADPLWPMKRWGGNVQVSPDARNTGHLRQAIQERSTIVRKRVYQNTGWVPIRDETGRPSEQQMFLHSDGAVGSENVSVQLGERLAAYRLPAAVADARGCIEASLALLGIGPLRLTLPLLLAVILAPLVSVLPAPFLLFLAGKSGSLKTALATLFSAHEGEELLDRPVASFTDSIASLESKLWALKDVLVVVDDFKPATASPNDEMRKRAATLISMIGNGEGRGRNNSDGTQRADRPPRGFVVATGEMVPEGESTVARMLVLKVEKGELDLQKLTVAQRNSARLSHAKRAYLEWLRPKLGTLKPHLKERMSELRERFLKNMADGHLRSPTQLAYLGLGVDLLADFAFDSGVFTEAERNRAKKEWLKVLEGLGEDATERARASDPAQRFVEFLRDLLASHSVELEDALELPAGLNNPSGKPAIGWKDKNGDGLLLQEVAYVTVAKAMQAANEPLPYTSKTLWPRLRELGLILPGDRDDRNTRRYELGGKRQPVIVMPAAVLGPADGPDDGGGGKRGHGPASSGAVAENRPSPAENRTTEPEFRTTEGPYRTSPSSLLSSQLIEMKEKKEEEKGESPAIGPVGPVITDAPPRREPVYQPRKEENALSHGEQTLLLNTGPTGPICTPTAKASHNPSVSIGFQSGDDRPNGSGASGPRPPAAAQALVGLQVAAHEATPRTVFLEPDPAFWGSNTPAYRWRAEGGGYTALNADNEAPLARATVVVHDAKPALTRLARFGAAVGAVRCTETAARLLTGRAQKASTYDAACREYLGGPEPTSSLHRLDATLQQQLKTEGLDRVAALEFELLPVVARMEHVGVGIDAVAWRAMVNASRQDALSLAAKAKEQLGTGSLTDADVLAALRAKGAAVNRTGGDVLSRHLDTPGVTEFLQWRRLSAFLRALGEEVLELVNRPHYDGRVRARFDPLGSSTGRMTCSAPNLHGLPKDADVRRCVVPAEGMVFVVADYSAIDLRVLSHVTGDESLRAVFKRGGDPHRQTASLMLGKPGAEITHEERQRAKPVNFGIVLGMGAQGLVEYALEKYGVNLSLREAEQFRAAFLEAHPQVADWQRKMKREAPGEVRTVSGRRRSSFSASRGYTERLATEIQGAAADGMKRAMVLVDRAITPLGARIVLAVHDELVVEAPIKNAADVEEAVVAAMVAGMSEFISTVPIAVASSIRATWAARDAYPALPRRPVVIEQLPMFGLGSPPHKGTALTPV